MSEMSLRKRDKEKRQGKNYSYDSEYDQELCFVAKGHDKIKLLEEITTKIQIINKNLKII